MFRGMKSFFGRTGFGRAGLLAAAILVSVSFCLSQVPTPTQARRLILKDGSYQSVTKYEVHDDRVRYFSAERGEWEEIPNSLIDWDATDKFEQGRLQGKLAPEAVELDEELEAEREAEQARSPQVAPGLRLPDEGGIFLLDTYQNQPQLSELQQSGGELDKSSKSNTLRAAINPLAGVKQTIELPGAHAKVQSHTTVPSLYINIEADHIDANQGAPATVQGAAGEPPPLPPTERFRILRIEVKGGKRIARNQDRGNRKDESRRTFCRVHGHHHDRRLGQAHTHRASRSGRIRRRRDAGKRRNEHLCVGLRRKPFRARERVYVETRPDRSTAENRPASGSTEARKAVAKQRKALRPAVPGSGAPP